MAATPVTNSKTSVLLQPLEQDWVVIPRFSSSRHRFFYTAGVRKQLCKQSVIITPNKCLLITITY